MDANTDTELSCLAYALVQFPARAFSSISLCFSLHCYSHLTTQQIIASFGTDSMWKPCYLCLSHSQPVHWWYYATSIYPHGLELDQSDDRGQFKLYPLLTTSVWCISASWRTYALLLPGHFHHFPVEDAIEYNYLPWFTIFPNEWRYTPSLLLNFLFQHPKVSSLAITVNEDSKTMPTQLWKNLIWSHSHHFWSTIIHFYYLALCICSPIPDIIIVAT